jgi:5S rRNA maturation endonuclease (ribonuclease M5)
VNLEGILSRLQGVRRNGSGWMALCPAHADRNPSLSINVRDGKVLLYCHARCSAEAVREAAGIKVDELFGDNGTAPRIAGEYPYVDETGKLLFQVVRYEPKSFRQRRPDGKGGWQWNLNGTRRVLYRLPEVLAAKSVLVCEGEKDAETAQALGLVATCNSGGAGKWREEYSESLRGKRVVIIADADEPGRKHAQQVAASLSGKATSVKVLEFPHAKDLAEWAAMGGTRGALLEVIRNTSETQPQTKSATARGFDLRPIGELLAEPDVPTDYLVDGLLVAGTASCTAAKPKAGKSTFARNLAVAVAHGEPFLGMTTKRGEVWYLALEERKEDVKKDFRSMGCGEDTAIHVHAAPMPQDGVDALCDLIRQRRPALVIGDPLFRMVRVKEEGAYAEMYTALGVIIDVCRETNTHVHAAHHAGKSEKADAIDAPLGTTGIAGAAATVIVLKRKPDNTRTIQTVGRIGKDIPETILRMDEATHLLELGQEKSAADAEALQAAILGFLQTAKEAKTRPEIEDAVGGERAGSAALFSSF